MRKLMREKPWLWIVFLLGFFMALSIAMLVIAELNRPILVR